jgi:hypothetical protein
MAFRCAELDALLGLSPGTPEHSPVENDMENTLFDFSMADGEATDTILNPPVVGNKTPDTDVLENVLVLFTILLVLLKVTNLLVL